MGIFQAVRTCRHNTNKNRPVPPLWMKTDTHPFFPVPLRSLCIEQVFDAVIDLTELYVVFPQSFFDHNRLCPYIVLLQENLSYFDKGAHDGDVHLYGLIAVQNPAEHGDALLRESVGQVLGMLPFTAF